MRNLLKLKHWQLFLLVIGIPLVGEAIAMIMLFVYNNTIAFAIIMAAMFIFCATMIWNWWYAAGVMLHRKLPDTVAMNIKRFKVFWFVPSIYFILILGTIAVNISNGGGLPPAVILLVIPLHLFCMFCIFYCLYFVAKAMKAAELQRPVSFGDFAGEFFLMWFFYIGIWILQPRINRLAKTDNSTDSLL